MEIVEIHVLRRKRAQNLLISYLFCQKKSELLLEVFYDSGLVCQRKLPDPY